MDPETPTYVTPVEDAVKLTRHQVFYQKNSKRLKQKAKERRLRSKQLHETLPEAVQEQIQGRRRDRHAVYRENHRDELREKERLRRQRQKASTGQLQKM